MKAESPNAVRPAQKRAQTSTRMQAPIAIYVSDNNESINVCTRVGDNNETSQTYRRFNNSPLNFALPMDRSPTSRKLRQPN